MTIVCSIPNHTYFSWRQGSSVVSSTAASIELLYIESISSMDDTSRTSPTVRVGQATLAWQLSSSMAIVAQAGAALTGSHPSWSTFLCYCNSCFCFLVSKKYSILSNTLTTILEMCTLVCKKGYPPPPRKTKAEPNGTPPFLLPLTHPLCMAACERCSG